MSSFNNITLVGNLGRDPELRYTPSGTPVCQFTMATNDRVKKGGDWEKHTTWFRVTVFGKQAEACSQYLSKGRQVYVQGRLRIEEWEDRDGKKRFTAEVTGETVQFLGERNEREMLEKQDHDDIPF
jgi:single-strand DNA-binding protein